MHKGFWEKLHKPIIALAPLANVTDAAFRRVIAKYSKPSGPDVMYTEFVSADGLFSGDEKARSVLMHDLIFTESERPIVAQFFTAKPEIMEKAVRLSLEFGFDGVDINMGCPDRSIEKQGAGVALIKTPDVARALIRSAKGVAEGKIPVSIKTRIGYNKNEIEEWLPVLLKEEPAAITLHLRTRKEMSKVSAHWDVMKRAVEIRNDLGSDTLLLGNGDVETPLEADKKARETGADGIMIGRGIFGNPFLFNREKSMHDLSIPEQLDILLEHTKLFEELLGDIKSFAIMKKHYKAYVSGFDGAKELRGELMMAKDAKDVVRMVLEYKKKAPDLSRAL